MFTAGQITAFIIGALGAILTILNIMDKHNTLRAKASEPFETLKTRVDCHEADILGIKQALRQGNDRFRSLEGTNEALIRATMALIEFEMQYCLLEHKEMSKGLEKAKSDLDSFLAKNRWSYEDDKSK